MRITGEFALKKSALLILMAWLCLACTAQAAQLNKIAAVVNGQVITMFDLQKAVPVSIPMTPSRPTRSMWSSARCWIP